MKKIISIVLLVLMFVITLGTYASAVSEANEATYTTSTTYFEDGSYIITTIFEESSITRATSSKTGQKTATFYNSDNVAQWSATLKGTFTCNGSSATCTASSITHKIYSSNWKIASASATKSGNKATGKATAKRYLVGIPVQTNNRTITLTCSASGVLS